MNRTVDVSYDEMGSYMDFDRLLRQHGAIIRRRKIMWWSGAVVFLISVVVVLFFSLDNRAKSTSGEDTPSRPSLQGPIVDSDTPQQDEDSSEKDEPEASTEKSNAEEAKKPEVDLQSPATNQPQQEQKRNAQVDEPTTAGAVGAELREESVYTQAEPVDGYENLFAYFREKLRYPPEAMGDSIQGIMKISFVITAEGKPQNIEVVESLGIAFEREAIKLIELMPAWKPAMLNGKPVKSKVTVPLTFQLKTLPR